MELSKELRKELYHYCELRYDKYLHYLKTAKEQYEETGVRPKYFRPNNDKKGDLIEFYEEKVDYYHNGIIELS